MLFRSVEAAERLKVKYVIGPECGHAYSALRWEGPNLLGRTYPFKVVHIVELLDQLLREGRLRTRGKDSDEVIRRRLVNAREEMAHVSEFEYVIINNEFEMAKRDLTAVIRCSRLHTPDVLTAHAARLADLFGNPSQED